MFARYDGGDLGSEGEVVLVFFDCTMKKITVIEMLESFEEEFTIEKFIEQLLFLEKIEKGLADVEEGKVINYVAAKQSFK